MHDPGLQGQAGGACLPQQGGPYLHQYGAQGDHCQHCIHRQRPQRVFEEDAAEEADESGGQVPPLGQHPCPHHVIVRDQGKDRDDGPTPLQSGPGLILVSQAEQKTGGGVPQRRDLQNQVGRH